MPLAQWRTAHRLLPRADWLAAGGSLTARLSQLGRFQVDLLFQGPGRCLPDEARLLGLERGRRVLVRHVCLQVDGRAVVLARSVISRRGLHGSWRVLRGLRTRSLGAALWSDPRIRREPPRYALLPATHPLLRQVHHRERLPARRLRYWLGGQPLLLVEAFLPAIALLGSPRRRG
jgi:chorismate lyase